MKKTNKVKICIVKSRYNDKITNSVLLSARVELEKKGINKIEEITVPGSFEIPVSISRVIKKYDGFIAIGCILKGETNNFDLISNSITNAIMMLSVDHKKPIGNAIITAFNYNQAEERAEKKGQEAANAVADIIMRPYG